MRLFSVISVVDLVTETLPAIHVLVGRTRQAVAAPASCLTLGRKNVDESLTAYNPHDESREEAE